MILNSISHFELHHSNFINIIPKRHFSDFFETTKPELEAIHDLARIRRKQLMEVDQTIRGFVVKADSGLVDGQKICHAHINLILRREGEGEV